MKVLHVSGAKGWRGGEQQIAYLVEELHQLGVEQNIALIRGKPLHHFLENKSWTRILPYKKMSALNVLLAFKLLNASREYDVVHAHDSHAHSAAYIASLLGMKTPVVVSRRVDFPVAQSAGSRRKYNHPNVRKILCVSDAIRKIVAASIEAPERAVTVHSGIRTQRFLHTQPTGKLRALIGVAPDVPLIGNTSALADHKDYPTFLRVAKRMSEALPQARFVILGEGEERGNIENLIAEYQLQDKLVLAGFHRNIEELLPDLDVFLMTSKMEGLGTSVLDAFACKVPVVATNAGGIPEMVVHEETGLLAAIGDDLALSSAVIKVLQGEAFRSQIVRQAFQRLEQFSTRKTAEETLAVYRSL
jgi:glycosyltransferase involved in cell wall biosynthesis